MTLNWEGLENLQFLLDSISKYKNGLYGSNNLIEYGSIGIWIRIADKFHRINKQFQEFANGDRFKNWDEIDEFEDNILDMINYLRYLVLSINQGLISSDQTMNHKFMTKAKELSNLTLPGD